MGLAERQFTMHNIYVVVVLIWMYYVVGIQTDSYFTSNSENFESVPTTVKTYENDTVLLPCYPVGELKRNKSKTTKKIGLGKKEEANFMLSDLILLMQTSNLCNIKMG